MPESRACACSGLDCLRSGSIHPSEWIPAPLHILTREFQAPGWCPWQLPSLECLEMTTVEASSVLQLPLVPRLRGQRDRMQLTHLTLFYESDLNVSHEGRLNLCKSYLLWGPRWRRGQSQGVKPCVVFKSPFMFVAGVEPGAWTPSSW